MPYEFEEARVDDVLCRILERRAWSLVAHRQIASVRIHARLRVSVVHRSDANEVSRYPRDQRTHGRHGPRVQMTLQEIGILLDQLRGVFVAAPFRKAASAGDRGVGNGYLGRRKAAF